mmetsp:Transcript_2883/g.13469  ORF Transcript_2883/g.13469 Transcript_2883/m.13469 type:complete len:255 (+) Transcript_2883:1138-1902(+)
MGAKGVSACATEPRLWPFVSPDRAAHTSGSCWRGVQVVRAAICNLPAGTGATPQQSYAVRSCLAQTLPARSERTWRAVHTLFPEETSDQSLLSSSKLQALLEAVPRTLRAAAFEKEHLDGIDEWKCVKAAGTSGLYAEHLQVLRTSTLKLLSKLFFQLASRPCQFPELFQVLSHVSCDSPAESGLHTRSSEASTDQDSRDAAEADSARTRSALLRTRYLWADQGRREDKSSDGKAGFPGGSERLVAPALFCQRG